MDDALELQWYTIELCHQGFPHSLIAKIMRCCRKTVKMLWTYYQMYLSVPTAQVTVPSAGPAGLTAEEMNYLANLMQSCPDLYLDEYCLCLKMVFLLTVVVVVICISRLFMSQFLFQQCIGPLHNSMLLTRSCIVLLHVQMNTWEHCF